MHFKLQITFAHNQYISNNYEGCENCFISLRSFSGKQELKFNTPTLLIHPIVPWPPSCGFIPAGKNQFQLDSIAYNYTCLGRPKDQKTTRTLRFLLKHNSQAKQNQLIVSQSPSRMDLCIFIIDFSVMLSFGSVTCHVLWNLLFPFHNYIFFLYFLCYNCENKSKCLLL